MSEGKDPDNKSYVDRAFAEFNQIMSSRHKNTLESINRPNKGELFVLKFLMTKKEAVLPSELSIALQSSTARISTLLGVLEKKGQIVRNIDQNNRRNILVTITDEGRKRAKDEMNEMERVMRQVFGKMGKEDTEEFVRLTREFSELVQEYLPQP